MSHHDAEAEGQVPRPRSRTPWSVDDDRVLRDQRRIGATIPEIADALGRSVPAVQRRAVILGLTMQLERIEPPIPNERMPWPDDFFIPGDAAPALACQAMWCAVIEDQLKLAQSEARHQRFAYEIDSARRWFGTRDFFIVCALAGFDGAYILGGVRQLLLRKGISV